MLVFFCGNVGSGRSASSRSWIAFRGTEVSTAVVLATPLQAKPESNFPTSTRQGCVCVYVSKTRGRPHQEIIHQEFKSRINAKCLRLEYFDINKSASILPFMIWPTWLDLAPNLFFQWKKMVFSFSTAAIPRSGLGAVWVEVDVKLDWEETCTHEHACVYNHTFPPTDREEEEYEWILNNP